MTKSKFSKLDDLYEDEDVSAESEDDLGGITTTIMNDAVVWSTDWTAATIVDQLARGTIALNPAFQRRDAWTNDRKSRFIESLILGLPIPQLVLAENNKAKGRFIVIDGKQRLLSLSKFTGVGLSEDQEPIALSGLKIRSDLNKKTYAEIKNDAKYEDLVAEFENQPIRTVVVRGWNDEKVLYTIFHRLNTGSVPLSTQELRQALHPGPFLTFAESFSEKSKALKGLLELTQPDFRMRDVELVVRYFAFYKSLPQYRGNLKKFLDDSCDTLNNRWSLEEISIRKIADQLDLAIDAAVKIFTHEHVFKKWDGSKFEKSLNRAIFDVVALSLSDPKIREAALKQKVKMKNAFKNVCEISEFKSAVESTTKSKAAVRNRFSLWYHALGGAIGKKIPIILPEEQ